MNRAEYQADLLRIAGLPASDKEADNALFRYECLAREDLYRNETESSKDRTYGLRRVQKRAEALLKEIEDLGLTRQARLAFRLEVARSIRLLRGVHGNSIEKSYAETVIALSRIIAAAESARRSLQGAPVKVGKKQAVTWAAAFFIEFSGPLTVDGRFRDFAELFFDLCSTKITWPRSVMDTWTAPELARMNSLMRTCRHRPSGGIERQIRQVIPLFAERTPSRFDVSDCLSWCDSPKAGREMALGDIMRGPSERPDVSRAKTASVTS
jgi:hypothetical protein